MEQSVTVHFMAWGQSADEAVKAAHTKATELGYTGTDGESLHITVEPLTNILGETPYWEAQASYGKESISAAKPGK